MRPPALHLEDAFAVAAPGLESIVASELQALGATRLRAVEGGVEFAADRDLLYRANLHLRCASRVVVRLARFRATSFAELERRVQRVPWERVLRRGAAVHLRVTCRKSRLYHSDAVEERVLRDLGRRMNAVAVHGATGQSEAGEEPDDGQLFIVRLDHDDCTISADASGAHLHRRGYRTAVTPAPMRETLAAALLLASGWEPAMPLVDPFCGSGTIPVEAAMLAGRLAPGRNRRFRFMDWPDFDPSLWRRLLGTARAAEVVPSVSIVGTDRSAPAIQAAAANAERAAVRGMTRFERCDVTRIESRSASTGWIITNPPYGVRLGDPSTQRALMRSFGQAVRSGFAGWHVGILSTQPRLGSLTGLSLQEVLRSTNGGLSVQFLTGVVPEPGFRSTPARRSQRVGKVRRSR